MSAFVIDPTHIDVLLSVAINGPRGSRGSRIPWRPPYIDGLLAGDRTGPLDRDRADRAGAALLAECIASVGHRYPDADPFHGLPGPIPTPDPERYEWTDFGAVLGAIEACKAIDCYEYQSCEHPGWRDSGSKAFCERFRSALIGAMHGYEQAEWHWDTELAMARAPRPFHLDLRS